MADDQADAEEERRDAADRLVLRTRGRDLPFEGTPVLSDEEFDRAADEIGALVESSGAPALA